MRLSNRLILVVGASDENQRIIKSALNQEFKLHFANTRSDADKYLAKNHANIFTIFIDSTILGGDISADMITAWYNDLRFQLLPLTVIYPADNEKIRKQVVEAGVITVLASPITEDYILQFVKSIDRRIKYSETRIAEAYEDAIKTNKNKLFVVSNAIDTSIMFLKDDGDDLFFEYANKKSLDTFGNVNYHELLLRFDNEDTARIIKTFNQAKGDYEHHSTLVKYFENKSEQIFEFIFTQIMNIDGDDALKFVLTVFDRTMREKVLLEYKENNDMLESILGNINGGVCVFRIENDNVIREYASSGIFKIGGYKEDDPEAIKKLLPVESQLLLTKKVLENAKHLIDGQNAEPFTFQTAVITSDFKERHIGINVSVYKKNDHDINVRALVIDNTEEYNYQKMLKHIAEYDVETNLFNSNKFVEVTEKLLHSDENKSYKLMVIRIHKFDEIRSFFGKDKSLELVKVVADGIRNVGKNMLKGRVDTKDFAVSFDGDKIDELKFIEELDNYVKENFSLYQVKLYYGIYPVSDVYESVDALLLQTKFGIKEIEGNALKNHIYCDAKMKKRMIENDNISSEMKKALERNEFEIFLQPVFDLKSRKIVSAEALTRWHHPKRGYIPPTEYIPIFEENGFIVNVDMFVWEGVCKIIRNWLDSGINAVPISVNVSRIDLFSIDFYTVITNLVEKYDIPIEYLRLEITESAFVLNENEVIEMVDKLRLYGFKILMDDFGSGYSSLNTLKFINIDILKIDMDLVKGIEESIRQANILKSVINLGNTLNLDMICEGVETENQAVFVEENGCMKAQGWLFSKAIPLDEFNKKMAE